MHAQRFVDTNPQALNPASGLLFPQSARAVPRRSGGDDEYYETLNEPVDYSDSGSWSNISGNVWGLNIGSASVDRIVFERNGQQFLGRKVASGVGPVQIYDWVKISTILQVYAESDPNGFYTGIWPNDNAVLSSEHQPDPPLKAQRLKRLLWHPGFNQVLVYPQHPQRTVNYYRSGIRKHDVQAVKTLQSNINVLDLQQWEDIVISEVWEGGANRLSMHAEFFDALHLFRITAPPVGRKLGWIPKDMGYQRHMIQPVALGVGSSESDVKEFRERPSTSMDSWIDQGVVFQFKLVRPTRLVDSLLTAEGY